MAACGCSQRHVCANTAHATESSLATQSRLAAECGLATERGLTAERGRTTGADANLATNACLTTGADLDTATYAASHVGPPNGFTGETDPGVTADATTDRASGLGADANR
ncbi:hypothetical protein AWC15_21860 [Mycobacterium lacus]|uniref:Uncharacterized protein n=1 Tax=Mycobacterium lacus TaxID=169765 RepID=A0A1X1Y5N0_9MYCO|nr:hypothetical protein AWC15_21860 [Mycobacterium lacus]BBX98548.1 hypothetical protein MLAC_38420 [Mycobacterium lacus]